MDSGTPRRSGAFARAGLAACTSGTLPRLSGACRLCRLSDDRMSAKFDRRYPCMEMCDHACTVGPPD